jgi:hypothetical protein
MRGTVLIDGDTGHDPTVEIDSRLRFFPNELVLEQPGLENALFGEVFAERMLSPTGRIAWCRTDAVAGIGAIICSRCVRMECNEQKRNGNQNNGGNEWFFHGLLLAESCSGLEITGNSPFTLVGEGWQANQRIVPYAA